MKNDLGYYTGEIIWESVNLTSLEISGVLRVIATATDITKQKQAEQNKIARQVAEEANRTKSAFLSNMSHEIRTPLNAIIGFAQVLRRDQTLVGKQAEHVKTILKSGEHLISLINDILDLSKIEAGHLSVLEKEFNVQDLMTDIQKMFVLRAKENNLYFEFEIEETVPKFICSDEAKLRQIFINLINNAFKFTSVGGVIVKVRADWSRKNRENRIPLFVEVSDTGQGISGGDKEHIFDPFWQAETGQAAGGTGLGLAICSNMIALMGGKLSVDSQIGKGSKFKFDILFLASDKKEDEIDTKQNNVIGLTANTGPFRILIADDKKDNRNVLRELIQPIGFEVCRRLKSVENLRHIPIIFISALDDIANKVAAFSFGGVDYITKPFQEEVFARMEIHLKLRSKEIYFAAPLHDIGKVGVPDNILLKPGKLCSFRG